jgi:zinc transport system substrate-binding protein
MRKDMKLLFTTAAILLLAISWGDANTARSENTRNVSIIVTSDTILSGMIVSLLPPRHYAVEAILPPGQCPGHYDVKFSDIRKTERADLIVSFRGMPFMGKAVLNERVLLLVDADNRNWMAPDSYIYGLGRLADELSVRFPKDKDEIARRKKDTIRKVRAGADLLGTKVKKAGLVGKPVIASVMQKEPLEWMGFRIAGEYGRTETMSVRDIMRLSRIGREQHVVAVVDNLQSGPDTGKGIAATLGAPHIVLTNFPSEQGYLATLRENVDAVMAAVVRK